MAKLFENSNLESKRPEDDPEYNYVNKMMEMPARFLRELIKSGESYESLHGVVPTSKLPPGYSFGNRAQKMKSISAKNDIKNRYDFSDKSSSKTCIENGQIEFKKNSLDDKMIEIVKGDLALSDEEEEQINNVTHDKNGNMNTLTDNLRLLFDTLEACSKTLPNIDSMNIFQKHYRPKLTDNVKKTLADNVFNNNISSLTGTSDKRQQPDDELNKLLTLLTESTYKPHRASIFQSLCNNIRKRKLTSEIPTEKSVTPPKQQKFSQVTETLKPETPDSFYQFHAMQNVFELSFDVVPKLTQDICDKIMKNPRNVANLSKELSENENKPIHVAKESLPFTNSDIKVESETNLMTTSQPVTNTTNISSDSISNAIIRKPEAVAKQYFANHSNYSNINNKPKVAVVAGKVNETQSNIQHKIDRTHSSNTLTSKGSSCGDLVVQGLLAMQQMRASYKNDFITRMSNLDNVKWLKEVNALKERAQNSKNQLDYAPQIMIFIRKNLFYNYSLEVKREYGTSHRTYLENAAVIKQICSTITQIYNEHEKQISDENSSRLWNIKLVKHYTVVMCHRLSAILKFNAFRNVEGDCRKIHETLIRVGAIERNDRVNHSLTVPFTETHSSPFSVLSSYSPTGHGTCSPDILISSLLPNHTSTAASTAPVTTAAATNASVTNRTGDLKAELQQYIEYSNILNSSYSDWLLARKLHVSYCTRSVRHEESWRDFEWKIVEKTGGVLISGIDESVPFVIKFLEGYINYMNEFMKRNL